MNSNNNVFDVSDNINGDAVIAFTSAKQMKTLGWMDSSKVSAHLLSDDDDVASHTKHLGMVHLYQTTHNKKIPFMKDLFEKSAVLEVAEGQSVTYDLPVNRTSVRCFTTEDTSSLYAKPGIDESVLEIVLNEEFQKGDILTYDPQYGSQIIISEDHDTEREGENFRHYATLVTNDKRDYFPNDKLIAGIQWMKIGHKMSEYGTNYSNINMIKNPAGSITNEFILGSPRGVETFYTMNASNMNATKGLVGWTEDMMEGVEKNMSYIGGKDKNMFFISKKNADGAPVRAGMKVGTTLEYLALMELALMECYELLFADPATLVTSNGIKRINEGAFKQFRRGKIIKYARPGGITINHLTEAAEYAYRNSDIEPAKRTLHLKGGTFAYQNVMQLFREEAVNQLNNLPAGMLGTDKQITGTVFSGSLDNLEMNAVQIRVVTLPAIGKLSIEYDPSMDYQPMADRFSAGTYGENHAHTSYSLVAWDISAPEVSNVNNKVKNASLVSEGMTNNNTYYVKPEGSQVIYGYEQGRMADGAQTTNVMSSMKYMGRTFWGHSQSASLLLDTTRYVSIELDLQRD